MWAPIGKPTAKWRSLLLNAIVISCSALLCCRLVAADEVATCQPKDFHFEFTECDNSGGRWRVSVPKPGKCAGGAPNPPTRVTHCNIFCDFGQSYNSNELSCRKCPAGTYSLGGGEVFNSWDHLPQGFHVAEESFSHSSFRQQANSGNKSSSDCSQYGWQPRGDFIASQGGPCSSSLFYSIKLVKPGSLSYTYQYQDDTTFFHFQVQNDQCQSIQEAEQNRLPPMTNGRGWQTANVELKTGLNVLHWKTIGVGMDQEHRPKPVMIKRIEITGVAYASSCSPCPNGTFSGEGSKFCEECPMNTYSDKGATECIPCKPNEYSMNRSSKCLPKLLCTSKDYSEEHTGCDEQKKMQVLYKWIEPKNCRTDLPHSAKLPSSGKKRSCPPCNPGMQYITNNSYCSFCPNNYYSDGRAPCRACPVTTVPNYGYRFISWNSMPPNMLGTCISVDESSCASLEGWQLEGDHIHSGLGHADSVYLVLSMKVDGFRGQPGFVRPVEIGRITFSFELVCTGDCEFFFLQSSSGSRGSVIQSWVGPQDRQNYTFIVNRNDTYTYTWLFQKIASNETLAMNPGTSRRFANDVAKIYYINVTNTADGGGEKCTPCQRAKKDGCIPCAPGHFINPSTRKCTKCPANTYASDPLGYGVETCEPCGPGLESHDGVTCFSSCKVTIDGNHYDFTSLMGNHLVKGSRLFTASGAQYYHMFNISLCGPKINGNTVCTNNITFRNPDLEHRDVTSIMCRSTIVPPNQYYYDAVSTQSVSLGDYLLGITTKTKLDNIKIPEDKFDSKEDSGIGKTKDVHFYYTSPVSTRACDLGRSSTVSLRCDTSQKGKGTILLPKSCPDGTCDGCNFHFLWLTRKACPTCTQKDFEVVKGECQDGKQTLHYIPPKHCLLPSWVNYPNNTVKKCSAIPKEFKIAIIAVGILGFSLILLVIYFWKKNRRLEYKYMKLVHNSSTTKDGELPPAESCALDDEEEDHIDSIQFKESKSKMLLNKIRAMAGNKCVDDDVMTPISGNYGKGRRIFPQTWL